MFKYQVLFVAIFLIWSCSSQLEEEIDCATLSILLTDTIEPTICAPPNGSIRILGQGGKLPYSFRLNDGPLQTDSLFSGLPGGSYQVEVMDANQCSNFITVTLSNFGSDLTATFNTTSDTECSSGNGQVVFSPTGGAPPYQLKFQNTIIENSLELKGLEHGIHQASIIDSQLCEFVMGVSISKGITNTSWSLDIKPIIDMRCAKPLCHVAGTGRSDLSKFSNVQQLALQIKSRTQNSSMPFDEPMASNEIQLIACWVDDGATNN